MHDQRAEALHLDVGKPASLMQNGAVRLLTREPLSDTQIQALVREIASPETAAKMGSGPVSFAYRAPSGEVQVEMKAGNGGRPCCGRWSPRSGAGCWDSPVAVPAAREPAVGIPR